MFSTNLEKAIHIATKIAKEHQNKHYTPAHLLKAILNKDFSLLAELYREDIDVYFIEDWALVHIEGTPKASNPGITVTPDANAENVLEEADSIKSKLNREEIDLLSVFIACITPGVGFSYDQLKSMPVSHTQVIDIFSKKAANNPASNSKNTAVKEKSASTNNTILNKFCVHKNSEVSDSNFNIIGRERELKLVSEILSRRSKPNVIISGETGVGKTALLNSLAQKVNEKKIVSNLHDANIYEILNANLFSGASYKGEIEDRLQQIFNELKGLEKPIVIIDDIHALLSDEQLSNGIINLLKSELEKGELTFVVATTPDQLRKKIASDEALERKFETILLEEPDDELSFRILKELSPDYEKHHKIKIKDETLKETIRLSKRYLKEKNLPDSAIDLIDRTMASIRVSNHVIDDEIKNLREKIDVFEKGVSKNPEEKNNEDAEWIYIELKNTITPLLLQKHDTEDFMKFKSFDQKITYIKDILNKIDKNKDKNSDTLTDEDVAVMVSIITGIPAGKVQSKEREKLNEMENTLKNRVIGQDHAVKTVSDAIIESRSGLSKAGQPIGSFFFSGPTGTGKTELAKSLAEFLFNDENAIIRFDMSEFKEEHSAALLYGAPPGYIGYEEGGLLVNKIRQKPYSIVLFDEIEKAHQSVFDIFLQILDEGKLHDRLGKEGDFSNAVILFTSNIGAEFIAEQMNKGIVPASNDLMEIMANYFRPEFLARISEIVPFSPITREFVLPIFNLHLKKELLKLTERLGINLLIDDETKKYLAETGFSPVYGVRPLKAVIRNKLKRPLSKMIISGEIKPPQTISVDLNQDELTFKILTND